MQDHLNFLNNLDLQQGKYIADFLTRKYFEYRSNANLGTYKKGVINYTIYFNTEFLSPRGLFYIKFRFYSGSIGIILHRSCYL